MFCVSGQYYNAMAFLDLNKHVLSTGFHVFLTFVNVSLSIFKMSISYGRFCLRVERVILQTKGQNKCS